MAVLFGSASLALAITGWRLYLIQSPPNVGDPVILVVFGLMSLAALLAALNTGLSRQPQWNYTKSMLMLGALMALGQLAYNGKIGVPIVMALLVLPAGLAFDFAASRRSAARNQSVSDRLRR